MEEFQAERVGSGPKCLGVWCRRGANINIIIFINVVLKWDNAFRLTFLAMQLCKMLYKCS